MAFIEVKDLSKVYTIGERSVMANDKLNFEIEKNEFAIILGASGAGKSTFLNILGGLDTTSSGDLLVDGKNIAKYSERELTTYRRYDMGFVFQFYNLIPNLTALENVELASQIVKNAKDPVEVLKSVGLGDRMDNFPSQLSGGEQQRVSIARAIAKNPKLLLCDEPTGALDYKTGKQILKLLQDLTRTTDTTVVLITHNSAIKNSADRLIEISDAKVKDVFVNDIKNMKDTHALYTTMLNEEGKIIDDVIVFRLEADKFLISTLYIDKMIEWFDKFKNGFDVEYKNITDKLTMFAIQGPKSKDLVNKIVDKDISDLKFFTIEDNSLGDLDLMVARAGFTGELGYELYVESDKKDILEEKIKEAGKEFDLVNITSDVIIGSLPGEKGYVLMSDLEGANPLEVGYGWTVAWDSDFIGKEALLKAKENVTRDLFGFELLEDGQVEAGDEVLLDGKKIGRVTKFTYGYTVEKFIGYCMIEKDKALEGKKVEIKTKAGSLEAGLCDRVFYDKDNERVRG